MCSKIGTHKFPKGKKNQKLSFQDKNFLKYLAAAGQVHNLSSTVLHIRRL